MKYGICLISSIPVRLADSHKSELVTELLFGESYTVLENKREWMKISCTLDDYTGWIDKNTAVKLSENAFEKLNQPPYWVLNNKMISLTLDDGTQMKILPGSSLPFFNPSKRIFTVDDRSFIINEKPETGIEKANGESVVNSALGFINAPYLWGGRSLFGIDCSGFTQVVYKINHVFLPRDSSQQALTGKSVNSVNETLPGDLAFFINNEDIISHVGIIIEDKKIIHASGRVKIEKIDSNGILNTEKQEYSHSLYCIRRICQI